MDKPVSEKDLIKVITGECSPKEREQVEKWMAENPENRERLRKLRKTWEVAGNLELRQNEDGTWEKILQRISNPSHLTIHRLGNADTVGEAREDKAQDNDVRPGYTRSPYSKIWWGRIAAACLLIISVLYLLYDNSGSDQTGAQGIQEIVAERGERMNITLNDGTSVVLNSASALRYPSHFNGDSREIELEGEAFFSVARNENKPFVVHTEGADIRVLGTKFNVNAYSYFDGIEVIVEDGEVAVKSDSLTTQQKDKQNEVVLSRGEYTVVKEGGVPTAPVSVALDRHLGWINGDLIFEATPLDVVIKKLELYYNRDFKVTDSSLFDRRLTASFKKESLTKVLDVLSIAMDIKYEQRDSLIYLEAYE